jgi:hypothetical protein
MNASTVTGYAWNSDVYCPDCIGEVVADATPEVADMHMDGEPSPVFAGSDTEYVCYCWACGIEIFTNVINQ